MKIKLFTILTILCVFFCGCSDERLSQPLEVALFGGGEAEAVPEGSLGPPPPHIAKLLWGEPEELYAETLSILRQYEDWKARGEGEAFKKVIDVHFEDTLVLHGMRRKYYTKYLDADGIAIVGNAYVRDQYFYAARELIFEMTSKRPELRKLLALTGEPRENLTGATYVPSPWFRMILYSPHQGGAAIPERFPRHPPGVGWCGPVTCVATANQIVVLTEESPNIGEVRIHIANVFIHEFTHALNFAIRLIDPTFDIRLNAAYAEARENGQAFGTGYFENFAVTAQNWFQDFSYPNNEYSRLKYAEFQERAPLMHAMMEEVFDFKNLGYIDAKRWD